MTTALPAVHNCSHPGGNRKRSVAAADLLGRSLLLGRAALLVGGRHGDFFLVGLLLLFRLFFRNQQVLIEVVQEFLGSRGRESP